MIACVPLPYYQPTSPLTKPKVVELLTEMSTYVHEHELGTTRYQITREVNKKSGVEEIIMLET